MHDAHASTCHPARKGLLPSLAALLLILCCAFSAYAGGVGFVAMQRVLEESDLGKLAREDLHSFSRRKSAELESTRTLIADLEKRINEDMNLSTEERRALIRTLEEKYRQHEVNAATAREALRQEEDRLAAFVHRRAGAAMRAVAQAKGLDLLISDPEAVGYVSPAIDVTDQVILEMNRQRITP